MGAFGQFGGGPIKFGQGGAIESRGQADAGPNTPTPAAAPQGGGVLPFGGGPNPEWGLDNGSLVKNTAATDNGGSYGMNGTGALSYGPGGFDQGTGTAFFDQGGEVPDADGDNDGDEDTDTDEQDGSGQQGAGASTFDPMQAIKQVASYGRQKMGLPQNFYGGQSQDQGQPAFDAGGEVPGVVPAGGDDVTAGGNNPAQGGSSMPDPRAALSYLTGAGNVSPDIANALEKRVDPQGKMDPAQRTLSTIMAAPSPDAKFGMMQHYRTRYNAYAGGARAALDQGNLAQAAIHATQAMSNVPTGYSVKFAPARGGVAMMANPVSQGGGQPQAAPQAQPAQQDQEPQQSFDDGGEVEDEDDQGAIPDQAPEDTSADTSADQETPSEPATDQGTSQPVVLNPDQFKKMMSDGYDKPIDQGFTGWLKGLLSDVNPMGSAQAAEMPAAMGPDPFGGLPHTAQSPSGWPKATTTTGQRPDVMGAMQDDQSPGQPQPQGQQQAQAQGQPQVPGQPPQENRDQRMDAYEKRVRAMAEKLFPSAGGMQAKNNYIGQMMQKAMESEFKVDQNENNTKGYVEGLRNANRLNLQDMRREQAIDLQGMRREQAQDHDQRVITDRQERNQNNIRSKEGIAANNQAGVSGRADAGRASSLYKTYINNGKSPDDAMQETAKALNMRTQDVQRLLQGGGRQPQGQPQGGQQTTTKWYNGKQYKRGPNGEAIPVQ